MTNMCPLETVDIGEENMCSRKKSTGANSAHEGSGNSSRRAIEKEKKAGNISGLDDQTVEEEGCRAWH